MRNAGWKLATAGFLATGNRASGRERKGSVQRRTGTFHPAIPNPIGGIKALPEMNTRSLAARLNRLEFGSRPGWKPPRIETGIAGYSEIYSGDRVRAVQPIGHVYVGKQEADFTIESPQSRIGDAAVTPISGFIRISASPTVNISNQSTTASALILTTASPCTFTSTRGLDRSGIRRSTSVRWPVASFFGVARGWPSPEPSRGFIAFFKPAVLRQRSPLAEKSWESLPKYLPLPVGRFWRRR